MQRFGFTAIPTARFDPRPGVTSRVSLAWWADSLDDPSPVFVGTAEAPRTVVVVWRTDLAGYLDDIDQWLVREWRLTAATFERLEAVHDDFHLGAHDLLVRGGEPVRLAPCRESLYRIAALPDLHERVRVTISDLERLAA